MNRTVASLALVLLVASCGTSRDAEPARTPPPEPPVATAPPAPAPPPAPPAPPPTPAPVAIGLPAAPAEPSSEARERNAAGLTALGRGDAAAARDAFTAAVAASPEWDTGRYNLACALARAGEVERAALQMEGLLSRDLPTVRRRLARDPDLAALRASPHTERLAAHLRAVESEWTTAAVRGMPVLAVRGGGTRGNEGPRLVRAGVWWHERARFVPLGESLAAAIASEADPETGWVATISARPSQDAEYGQRHRVHALPMLGDGDAIEHPIDGAVSLEAHPIRQGARFRFLEEPMGLLRNMYWVELTAAGTRDTRERAWHRPSGVTFFPSGAQAPGVTDPTDLRLERESQWGSVRKVVTAEGLEIPLAEGHGSCGELVRSRDGRTVLLATGRSRGATLEHAIDRIDLPAGTVTRISAGEGWPIARFGTAGDLFIQKGETVVRLPSPTAPLDRAEPLPAGLLLAGIPSCGN